MDQRRLHQRHLLPVRPGSCHPYGAAAVLWIPGPVSLNSQVDFWLTAKVGLRGHVCTHGITGLGSCSLFSKS